ncbi:MAG: hypothetical protein WKG00_33210 [Polyangiaceae bacterium]
MISAVERQLARAASPSAQSTTRHGGSHEKSLTLVLMLSAASLSFVPAASSLAANELDVSGNEPAIPLPGEDPCPACGYSVLAKQVSGVLDARYSAHTYPLTNMRLRLYNASGNLLAGPFNLTPTAGYGNQNMAQTIPTTVTSNVARAVFAFHTADGYNLTQDFIVQ